VEKIHNHKGRAVNFDFQSLLEIRRRIHAQPLRSRYPGSLSEAEAGDFIVPLPQYLVTFFRLFKVNFSRAAAGP
jgi:hypothetical protein